MEQSRNIEHIHSPTSNFKHPTISISNNQPHPLNKLSSSFQNPQFSSTTFQQHFKVLQKRMQAISTAQQSLHQKCKKIIQNLCQQIATKDEHNKQLEEQIKQLREGISNSKSDMNIISSYLLKQKQKNSRQVVYKVKHTLNSTKDSGRIEKSIEVNASLTDKGKKSPLKASIRSIGNKSSYKNVSKIDLFSF